MQLTNPLRNGGEGIPYRVKIGELLMQEKLLTAAQLEQALANQRNHQASLPLEEVCVKLGFLSRADLSKVFRKIQNSLHLGELLRGLGLVSQEQLQQALAQHRAEAKQLGAILIEKGVLTETTLLDVFSKHLGVPKLTPSHRLIDKTLLQGFSEGFLQKNVVLPAFKQDGVLTLIMADPCNESLLGELEKVFGCPIQPAVATAAEIQNSLTQCFLTADIPMGSLIHKPQQSLIIGQTNLAAGQQDSTIELVNTIISQAIREGASDIHIEPQEERLRVRYRIDGVLVPREDFPLSMAQNLISRIKVLCKPDSTERQRHQDGRVTAWLMDQEVDLRVATYVTVHGENVAIRILQRQSPFVALDALGFSPFNGSKYQELLDYPSGVILVTGPTGSGKSTTLYASLHYLNRLDQKILTLEDPVEYYIEGVVQGQLDPKLELTYRDFLKAMMRQDPDVLMIGEVRDEEAAKAVIQAALTGHKVFSTFHTEDSIGALLRLMNMGIETLISSTLVSVVAQRLVRVLCPDCRQPTRPSPALLAAFYVIPSSADEWTFYQAKGCTQCRGTGFRGRTAIHELLVVNDAVRDAILASMPSSQIRRRAREEAHLVSMREDGLYKATQGITSLKEILRVVFHNESDALLPRSVEEIVALCEGKNALTRARPEVSMPEKEVYRIRFDCNTIAQQRERIAELFQTCEQMLRQRKQPFGQQLFDDFAAFVIETVKRLQTAEGAEWIEFILKVRGEKIRIAVESFPQRRPLISAISVSETVEQELDKVQA